MLNVANWTDKQLDELVDMLRSADCSVVASWLAQNYLAAGSRIMTDPSDTTLRVTVGSDIKTVDLSPGVFQHAGYIGQVDTSQIINILDTVSGSWGTGQISDPSNPRWSIIVVKQNEQLHTVAKRWFVNDTVVPNTYYQTDVNTLINKASYEIVVIHGTPASIPVVPEPPAGYWTIAEIRVPYGATSILQDDIYDTGTLAGSQKEPPNWLPETRVLRLEFLEQLIAALGTFEIDHNPDTGYHRLGSWHIGNDLVGGTVTAGALNRLTNGSILGSGELHAHGGVSLIEPFSALVNGTPVYESWTTLDVSALVPAGTRFGIIQGIITATDPTNDGFGRHEYVEVRKDGSSSILPWLSGYGLWTALYGHTSVINDSGQMIVPLSASRTFQYRLRGNPAISSGAVLYIWLVGYLT